MLLFPSKYIGVFCTFGKAYIHGMFCGILCFSSRSRNLRLKTFTFCLRFPFLIFPPAPGQLSGLPILSYCVMLRNAAYCYAVPLEL